MRIIDRDSSIRNVLYRIKTLVDGRPHDDRVISQEAYFAWQRAGCRDGNDQGDWYSTLGKMKLDEDFDELRREMDAAADRLDFRVQLGLSVFRNVAIFLGVRPTDLFIEYQTSDLDERQITLIVAGVGYDLCYRFKRRYPHAITIGHLIRELWEDEYSAYKRAA